jgi:hypothetical protein
MKHDLREFELRSDRVSLQEWWKPQKKAAPGGPASPFDNRTSSDEEESVFAQDI